jgi:hypothetical protein
MVISFREKENGSGQITGRISRKREQEREDYMPECVLESVS